MLRYQYLEMTVTIYSSGSDPTGKTHIYQLSTSHPKALQELKPLLSSLFSRQPDTTDEMSMSWTVPPAPLSFPIMRVLGIILDAGWEPFTFDTQAYRFRRQGWK